MEFRIRASRLAAGLGLMMIGASAQAAPVASGPALTTDGDGVDALWVRAESSPQSIQDAIDAIDVLASAGALETARYLLPYIDVRDFGDDTAGQFPASDLPDPFTAQDDDGVPVDDPMFAVRFSGFLNIQVTGEYSFQAHTDDGFRLALGGVTVAEYDGNRGPESSFVTLALTAGLYRLEFIGWEQGGVYVDELSWLRPGAADYQVIGTEAGGRALFSSSAAPVPVPAALPLRVAAIAALGHVARRRRA